jgi:hypothetical protein
VLDTELSEGPLGMIPKELFTEAASEKPRRGRPPLVDPKLRGPLLQLGGIQHLSSRQQRTWLRASRAIARLGVSRKAAVPKRFAWLTGDGGKAFRLGILSELSHVTDDKLMRKLAAIICRDRPSTQEASAFVRRFRARVQRRPAATAVLSDVLLTALNRYLLNHPEITQDMMLDALEKVEDAIHEWSPA